MIEPAEILNASILIVDDQPANVLLLEKILRNQGYLNFTSTTDPRTVRVLHRNNRYDLILLDLHMPEVDGFQVMEELQAIESGGYLPVLVITAQPGHKLRALKAGARDFISKPFDVIEVQTRIRNMLEVRLLYQRLGEHNQILERTVRERTASLRESEARLRSFARLSADWFWEQDQDGRITEASGPVLEMLGIDGEAQPVPAGWAAKAVWNAQERAALLAHIAARQPFIDLLCSRTQGDGRLQYLQVSGEPIFDDSSRYLGFRGVGSDVTDRAPREASRAPVAH